MFRWFIIKCNFSYDRCLPFADSRERESNELSGLWPFTVLRFPSKRDLVALCFFLSVVPIDPRSLVESLMRFEVTSCEGELFSAVVYMFWFCM